jgi:Tol biopolymer transport system component
MTTLDGSKPAERLTTSADVQIPGAWSRAGDQLVFANFKGTSGDIFVLRRGDPEPRPIVSTPADERDPVLSPDDRWLAYASNESGQYEVYVRPFPGPGGRIAVSTGGGVMPVWARDGRRLLYLRSPNDLMAVEVTANTAFTAGSPRVLLSSRALAPLGRLSPTATRNFDIARDGRILVTNDPSAEVTADALRIVLHFEQDIGRRLTPSKP